MKHHLLFGAVLALVASACAGAPDTTSTPSSAASARLSRVAAVSAAQRDANRHFGFEALAPQSVSRSGPYWVVELGAPDGSIARYAIADDGSIRERRMKR